MSAAMTPLNAAGDALRDLGIGAVRLRYRPADHLIPRDLYSVWIEATETSGEIIGTGDTPDDALADAIKQRDAV